MFYEGSLQSGISLAISQQKLVACFVRDDTPESAIWENEWLQSGWLSSLLQQNAVLLRLEAGSTEAGFLSAFCPISNTPMLVVIHNGQLREQLVSGVGKDEFINRVRKVLGAEAIPNTTQPSTSTPAESRTPETVEASNPDEYATQTPPQAEHHPVSPILPPSAKAKGKQKATPPEPKSDPSSTISQQQSARDALRKKKVEEKEELERIKARIEADKAERRAQAEARKAERELGSQSSHTSSQFPATTSKKGSQAKEVHLNVRLFDGHNIRSTFPRTATLQDDVRSWIDQEFAAKAENPSEKHPPYIFKQILAPLPSRELSTSDENQTLGDIELAPSATLVLIPVKGYTEAYSGGGGGNVNGVVGGVTGIVGGAFSLVASTVGYVGSALGSLVGYGSTTEAQEERPLAGRTLNEARPESSTAPATEIRVRTLADQREGEPKREQFYNGNQLNFEPNEDESSRK
ncbi:hypothetical protein K469DRAFT_708599 [Zopfia rhizophila CBS 207.26]|uniref:UBX domain-containing protein 2 n=1 Tax=Zopfia rhizophila CBS 207.26 TaxID=1314779 RepID=A0A6A6DYR2_9PEZI|nr:hypothetical protein K469DRAFT_708599 [Zopfia rhizophila CBS 207.26]